MLGLGTRLFISPESSYGVEVTNNYTNGVSASAYDPMHTYYIKNNRPSTNFNYEEVEFLSNSVSRENIIQKNVSHIEGNFDFNLQTDMTKLFSILTHYPISISDYDIENTLTTEVIEIKTIPNTSNVGSFSNTPELYLSNPIVNKKILNNVKSSTIIQTLSDKDINTESINIYKFTGMCPTSFGLNITQDSTIGVNVSYIGQKEILTSYNFSGNNIYDAYNDVYASWQAELKIDFNNDTNFTLVPFSDLNLEVNSNLEFTPHISQDIFNVDRPFFGLKEVTGSFTIEYTDDSYYNMIRDVDNVNMRIEITNGTSYFHIIMPSVNFLDGGSLNTIASGGMELDLSFLAKSNLTTNYIDETGNWETENPTVEETTFYLPYESDIIFKIKE